MLLFNARLQCQGRFDLSALTTGRYIWCISGLHPHIRALCSCVHVIVTDLIREISLWEEKINWNWSLEPFSVNLALETSKKHNNSVDKMYFGLDFVLLRLPSIRKWRVMKGNLFSRVTLDNGSQNKWCQRVRSARFLLEPYVSAVQKSGPYAIWLQRLLACLSHFRVDS